ncbi:exonuclease domain-containing protein [Clostridium felsineum]|uniref:3'-5' exonuclease DinG n=1 Tax=Clostridium felsineum TaxID=36839 RepID=A0A1S8MEN7_9CLOT|nr:exonuclease domain-containing protein [Clostridium felsineum]URZ07485.1 3'-5' exonuclease DinG [Clostridium felsineum]URZ12516.1 3'-5' exonuclease DinG [Clostridium felsineum]
MGFINKLVQGSFDEDKIVEQHSRLRKYDTEIEPYNKYMTYNKSSKYPDDFIVFDFETTGLDTNTDKIIEIGAIKYRGNKKADEFITYVNPERPIPRNIVTLTGIRDSNVKNAPTITSVLSKFIDFIGEDVLIAHNAKFDMRFLLNNAYNLGLKKPKNEVIDTLNLSRKYMKNENGVRPENYKLITLKEFLGIKIGSHNSADDCIVCAEVYKKCKSIKENFNN